MSSTSSIGASGGALIRAVIDTDALRANLRMLRAKARGARVMAVVKANAYGHGLVPTALALPEADSFAVARLEEGVALRDAGVKQPIVLLEGVFSASQLDEAAARGFELVVHDPLQVALLQERAKHASATAAGAAHRFVLWLKTDTGMNRLGFRPEEARRAFESLLSLESPAAELRLLTHLARADERDSDMTLEQVHRFRELVASLPTKQRPVQSISNSAGFLGWSDLQADWVRPGVALYGVSPFANATGSELGLKSAMRFETTVIALREVKAGETVGYGGAWRADAPTQIAIVAGGYGDGLPRSLGSGTPVLIEGQRAPLVGRVSMDMLAVDVRACANVQVGSKALLWGPELPVEKMAEQAGTIPYELLCGVRQRVPREIR